MEIMFLGNSVVQQIRPYRNNREIKNYVHQFKKYSKESYEIVNLSQAYWTIDDLKKETFLRGQRYDPDVVVINIGVNDAFTRGMPKLFWKILNSYSNSGILIKFRAIINKYVQYIQPFVIKCGLYTTWTNEKRFEKSYLELVRFLKKEFSCRIIVLNIPKTTQRLERLLPYSNKKIINYNSIINKIVNEENLQLININNLVSENESIFPEGVHYSAEMHDYVADELLQIIKNV